MAITTLLAHHIREKHPQLFITNSYFTVHITNQTTHNHISLVYHSGYWGLTNYPPFPNIADPDFFNELDKAIEQWIN